jgi:hypothetical protein
MKIVERELWAVSRRPDPGLQPHRGEIPVARGANPGMAPPLFMGFSSRRPPIPLQLSSHSAIQPFSYPAIQLSSHQAIQPSSYPAIQLSSHSAVKPSSYPAIQLSSHPAVKKITRKAYRKSNSDSPAQSAILPPLPIFPPLSYITWQLAINKTPTPWPPQCSKILMNR